MASTTRRPPSPPARRASPTGPTLVALAPTPYGSTAQTAAWVVEITGFAITERAVQDECRAGRLRHLKLGRRYLIHRDDLVAWLRGDRASESPAAEFAAR